MAAWCGRLLHHGTNAANVQRQTYVEVNGGSVTDGRQLDRSVAFDTIDQTIYMGHDDSVARLVRRRTHCHSIRRSPWLRFV